MQQEENALIILGRPPGATHIKTRLAKTLGQKAASKVYQIILESILRDVRKLPPNIKPYFFYAGGSINQKKVQNWLGSEIEAIPPKYSDIYQHINWAIEKIFRTDVQKIVVLATDLPDITNQIITQAFASLNKADFVIGPDNDGGIYLFGTSSPCPELFKKHPGGGSTVFNVTIRRIIKLNKSFHLLDELIDLDTLEDLKLWWSTLKGN